MRYASLFLIASVTLSSGCAGTIAGSGKDLTVLKTRDEIHAQLGEPDASGLASGGSFEEYHTRRKISDPAFWRLGEGYAMALVFTCGAVDLILVPKELYIAGRRTLLGQTIRVTYGAAGIVTGLSLDGDSLFMFGIVPDYHVAVDAGSSLAGQSAGALPTPLPGRATSPP